MDFDGVVGIDREAYHTLVTYHLYTIVTCRIMSNEAPGSTTNQSAFESETGTQVVLHFIEVSSVALIALHIDNDAKDVLDHINLMRS